MHKIDNKIRAHLCKIYIKMPFGAEGGKLHITIYSRQNADFPLYLVWFVILGTIREQMFKNQKSMSGTIDFTVLKLFKITVWSFGRKCA